MPVVPAVAAVAATTDAQKHTWADRLGIPGPLRWGFVGLLIFMIGDGVESGYLSAYLLHNGLNASEVALMFTSYGIAAGIAAWASGALSDLWGPRRVMMIGLGLWVGFQLLFLTLALPHLSYPLMLAAYGLRGLGYPMFAYGFLVWIAAATPQDRLGSAVGWFWFAFTGGLPTLGALIASATIPAVGEVTTLWIALVLVVAGGLFALLTVRERTGFSRLAPAGQKPVATLASSLTILWRQPKIGAGAIVRTINTMSLFGGLVFLPPFYTDTIGFKLSEWLQLLSVAFLVNIAFNLIFGIVGDRFGWRQTVSIFGGIGCAVTTLGLYYVPLTVGTNFALNMLALSLWGAALAGFVPLSALMPSLAPERKGAAMSALNFGAGISVFLGPLVVMIFLGPIGVAGVVWIFAILYLVSAVLAWKLTLPPVAASADDTDETSFDLAPQSGRMG